jgi:hypothetical protein
MSMSEKDTSILTQVAFKGAIQVAVAHQLPLGAEQGQLLFTEVFTFLTDNLFTEVNARIEQNKPATPTRVVPSGPTDQVLDDLNREFAPTPVNGADPIQIKESKNGGKRGPFPEWGASEAARKGVTGRLFWDNRGPNGEPPAGKKPWFSEVVPQGAPFGAGLYPPDNR